MKKILLYVGLIVVLIAAIPLLNYALDYNILTDYGKGFIWGKILLLLVGAVLIGISQRK